MVPRSSSSHSSSDHSSSRHSITVHSISGHTPPDTIDANSSTPLRFVHLPLVRTPRCSKAHLRWRDSISSEDSVEKDIDTDVLEDIEADAMAFEVAIDRDLKAGVDTGIGMEVDVGVDVEEEVEDEVESSDRGTIEVGVEMVAVINIPDGMHMSDAVECLEQVEEGLQDIYEHVMEMPLQRIKDIETRQRELEVRSLIAGRERASLLKQVVSLERSNARL
nr:hypothetical protein [Tanacetum cinerariifolium]